MTAGHQSQGTREYPTGGEDRYFTLTMPGDVLPGDVFIINVTTNVDAITTITKPTDAVEIMAMGGVSGAGVSGGLYWYEVPATPPASIVFDWGVGITRRGTLAWVQARPTGSGDLVLHKQNTGTWAASSITSHVAAALDLTDTNALLYTGVMIGSGSDTPTIAGTWTPRTDATQREGRMASRVQAAAGTTGTATWTTTAGYRSRSWQIALVEGGIPAPVVVDVLATAQTEYMPGGFSGDIADTPAIWVDTDQPPRSVVLGSRKAVTGGGIDVYDLAGRRLSFYGVGEVNNVMLRDLRGKAGWGDRILVIGTNRTNNTLAVAWLDRATRTLTSAGSVAVGFEPYGCCLYISPVNGDIYAFVSEATGGAGGLKQFRLTLSGSTVSGIQVRSMPTATLSEGMACDDATQTFFLTEEAAGFYKYGAEPGAGTSRTAIDTVGAGYLTADVEGVAIAYGRTPGDDKIIVSSQGSSTFVVYNLASPHAYVKTFRVVGDDGLIDDVTETDGIAVTRADLGPQWADGLFVAHDTTNPTSPASNFKFVDAGAVLGSYRTPPAQVTGTDTATLTAPVDRWVKGTMRPVWRGDDGIWRAILPTGSSGHRFYTLDPNGTNVQGAVVDNRTGVRCTAFHFGGVTYVLRVRNASIAGLFAKYDSTMTKIGSDVTVGLSGLTDIDAQPVSMIRSPNGYLWIAYTSSGAVRVQRSTDDGATWSASSAVVTLAGVAGPVGLAMSGTTVVLLATDNASLGRWVRTIPQASAGIAAADWSTEAMAGLPSGITSDDHLSMIGLPDGRVVAVSKTTGSTSSATPVLYSAIRSAGGVWTMQTLEAGPDETPPSYTRPVITVVGSEVRVVYGSIYGHLDLSTRTTAVESLGTWSERGVMLVGPDFSDSAVLPPPESLVGLTSGFYPILAHDRSTKKIVVHWQAVGGGASGGDVAGYLNGVALSGGYLGAAAVTGTYLGAVPV